MIIIQLFIGIIFALGIGCILFDVFKVPSMKASRATHNLGRKGDKKVSNIKLFLEGFAAELAPKLKLNEWKKHELEEDLRAAGMGEITPELFVARAATKALFIGIFAIPAFFIFKILGLLVFGASVFVYFGETKGITGKIKKKRAKIEAELPRLVYTVNNKLTHTRDVISILDSYKETAGPEFKDMLSIDASPITTDQAIRQSENKLLAVETNISNWQRKQNQNNNFSATIPYDMERQRNESREFLNDLVARDQRMIPALITIVHTADTKEKLDADTESIRQCARKNLCSLNILRWQQLEGLNTVLPYGAPKLTMRRTLTTESLAVFMPFRVQEVCHNDGIYFANNAISKNMIMINRNELLNGNSFITGVSGSGKSLLAKQEVINLFLADKNADIIIIDPEKEYGKICDAFGGETIEISATSSHHINAMDINMDYADGQNPVTLKSEFMLSLCEQAVAGLGPKQKSLIDRCTANVLNDYMLRGFTGNAPTLQDFNAMLKAQPEPEAKDIALSLELFTSGSLDTFAGETNVDTENRLICYDIHDLGKQLMPIGMLVVLDNILNRITANKAKGRETYVFIDEIYLLFKHEYSANFLFTLWKRVRKYGAFITGITQNVEDLLQSHTARTMLANSELVVMLNQAATDRAELADLMGISDLQMSYITGVEAGHGLVKIGSALVPFVNRVPKDTMLYKLMSTKPGEA